MTPLWEFGPQYYAPSYLSSNVRLDASGTYYSMVFACPKDGTITDIGFYISNVTSSGTFEVSLVTVEDSGEFPPTDLAYGGSSGTVFYFDESSGTPFYLGTGWKWFALDQSATASIGDIIAAKINPLDVSVWPSGNRWIEVADDVLGSSFATLPRRNIAGTFSAGIPYVAVRYSDGDIYGFPISSVSANAFNSGSSTNYYGNKFSVPCACTINGVLFSSNAVSAPYVSASILLYDESDAILRSKHFDAMEKLGYSDSYAYFTPVDLETDKNYRIVFQAENNQNLSFYYSKVVTGSYSNKNLLLNNVDYLDRTYKTISTGLWTDDPSSFYWMRLLISNINATGTSGGTVYISSGTSSYYGWAY
jgi:hypothetical protein